MSAGELIMRCFHARTAAHVLHLKTRSYAVHKALNDFYDAIVPLADSFAEAYQGDYGLIESYPSKVMNLPSDALDMLDELSTWIEQNRYKCCDEDDTYLQNIIDELIALIRSTQYKLKFLK
jgi:Family of unknown function (DUF5856)